MIGALSIKNYKSIKHLGIKCKKINLFIGEPNSGKSNIIESLSLMSPGMIRRSSKPNELRDELSKEIIRYNSIGDLFFDFQINKPIEISVDPFKCKLHYAIRNDGVPLNQFHLEFWDLSKKEQGHAMINIGHDGLLLESPSSINTNFRFYEFKRIRSFQVGYSLFLIPPYGENLPSLLLSNEELNTWTKEFFQSKGFFLTHEPAVNEINMSKFVNSQIYSYPYHAISETLQRVVFYNMAIKSNKDSILLFDEPDSNTFPFYTQFIAERIALDDSNQFFLTTHNPYLLLNLIEKSDKNNINVFVTKMKDYETEAHLLSPEQLSEVLDLNTDVFVNLDRIIE